MVLIPVPTMASKSWATRAGSGYSVPSWSGRKGPYVTPRTYTFSSPTKRNFPRTCGRGEVPGQEVGLHSRARAGLLSFSRQSSLAEISQKSVAHSQNIHNSPVQAIQVPHRPDVEDGTKALAVP